MEAEEDPVIRAALAKLEEDDPVAASDAEAALDWIAGEHGLSLVTQETVQRFLWYDLALKWMTGLDEKLAIVDALARVLDLLDLPRYSAICRSDTTREVL